jgi:hypothetical protein
MVGSDEALYVVTNNGQLSGESTDAGAIIRVTLEGEVTVVAYKPETINASGAAVVESSDGYLYGVAYTGGDHDVGAIFRAALPLAD